MKNPVDLHIGKNLRHRRWLQGMTQAQLAAAIGVRFQQIQKYESGTNRMSAARLWDVAQALNVPVTYFYVDLGGAGAEPEAAGHGEDVLQHKETMELVRAYYAIDEAKRRCIFELAQAASKPHARDAVSEILPFARPQSAA